MANYLFQKLKNSEYKLVDSTFLIFIFIGIFLRIYFYDQLEFVWDTAIDMERASHLSKGMIYTGSSMNDGQNGYTPGGVFYYILYFFSKGIGLGYFGQHLIQIFFHILTIFVFLFTLIKYIPVTGALFSVAILSCSTGFLSISQAYLCSHFAIFFHFLSFYFFCSVFIDRKIQFLPWLVLFGCLASQIYFPNITILVLTLFFLVFYKMKLNLKIILISGSLLLIMYGPYLIFNKSTDNSVNSLALNKLIIELSNEVFDKLVVIGEGILHFTGGILNPDTYTKGMFFPKRNGINNSLMALVISIFSWIGIFFFGWGVISNLNKHTKDRFIILLMISTFLSLLAAFLITHITWPRVQFNRFYFLIPFVLTFVGIGLSKVVEKLEISKKAQIVASFFIIIFFFSNIYYWESSKRITQFKYPLFKKISQELNRILGFEETEILEQTIFVVRYKGYKELSDMWIHEEEFIDPEFFNPIFLNVELRRNKVNKRNCVIVIFDDQHPNTKSKFIQNKQLEKILREAFRKHVTLKNIKFEQKIVGDYFNLIIFDDRNQSCKV